MCSTGAALAEAWIPPAGSTSSQTPATSPDCSTSRPTSSATPTAASYVCWPRRFGPRASGRSPSSSRPRSPSCAAIRRSRSSSPGSAGHIGAGQALTEEEFLHGFLRGWGLDLAPPQTLTARARRAVRSSMTERPPWEAELPLDRIAATGIPALAVRGAWDALDPVGARPRRRGVRGGRRGARRTARRRGGGLPRSGPPAAAPGQALQRPGGGVLALGVRAGLSARSTPPARTPGPTRRRSPPARAHGCRTGASRRRPRSRSTTRRRWSLP